MKINMELFTNKLAKFKLSTLKLHFIRNPFYLLIALILFCSHDLYIKMETYFLQPNQEAILSLYNGTFEKSENIITRDRMLDASMVSRGKRVAIKADQWTDKDTTITQLAFHTSEAATYVAGVSTKPRNIALSADKFNDYLSHDGVVDMLEQRTKNNLLDQDAVESYQKHVKAIYQVGDTNTEDWNTVLGYPIEFVPQANPYDKYSGDNLAVQLLLDGKPLSNQLVYADCLNSTHSHEAGHIKNEHSHEHEHDNGDHSHSHSSEGEESHTHTGGQQLRTNDQGIFIVDLTNEGIYFLRSIYMTTVTDNDELTHRSKWATLTFEVSHRHDGSTHTHSDAGGLPTWMFVVGSLLIVGLLFFAFRKKN